MSNEEKRTLEMAGEKKVTKKARYGIVVAVIAVVAIATAVMIGFHIYSMPENQLARALDLGQKYLQEEDYEQAIVEFNKVLKIDPKYVDAYLGIADAYIAIDNVEAAIAILEPGYKLTGNEEIRQRLDQLRSSMAEENVEIEESMMEVGNEQKENEKEELLYYELGFSPKDFTLAGYSVMDGDHRDDILAVVAEEIPESEDIWGNDGYSAGWFWDEYVNEKSLLIEYTYENSVMIDGDYPIEYIVESEHAITLNIGDVYDLYEFNNWPTDILSERPFYAGSVITGISSYEDVLDILGIREVVQQTSKAEKHIEYYTGYDFEEDMEVEIPGPEYSVFSFESQYGNTECRCDYYENGSKSYEFSTEEWIFILRFDDTDMLCGVKIASY